MGGVSLRNVLLGRGFADSASFAGAVVGGTLDAQQMALSEEDLAYLARAVQRGKFAGARLFGDNVVAQLERALRVRRGETNPFWNEELQMCIGPEVLEAVLGNRSPHFVGTQPLVMEGWPMTLSSGRGPIIEESSPPIVMAAAPSNVGAGNPISVRQLPETTYFVVEDGYDWTRLREENPHPPTMFHGTSSVFLEGILRNGLRLDQQPISEEELKFLNMVMRIVGRPELFAAERLQDISTTFNYSMALDHARKGPEIISRILARLRAVEEFELGLTEASRQRFLGLKAKYERIMASHRPVILFIRRDLEPSEIESGQAMEFLLDTPLRRRILALLEGKPDPYVPKLELGFYGGDTDRDLLMGMRHVRQSRTDISPSDFIEAFARYRDYAHHPVQIRPEEIVQVAEVTESGLVLLPKTVYP